LRQANPNAKQLAVLRHVAERVKLEWDEESSNTVATSSEDPLFDLVHGLPGTGKSEVIAWIRELFEVVLAWSHDAQFVCLAFQNATAAGIGGNTIHSWAEIQSRTAGGKPKDINVVFLRCQSLRWILIDEISMVSAELLFELQWRVSEAARPIGTYKFRPDKSPRPFGGFNILLFGDWWQLPPVQSTALFEQPSKAKQGAAFEGVQLLWARTRDSLRGVWELDESMRCQHPWFQRYLSEQRDGKLTRENYFYVHGAATQHVGSFIPGDTAPRCGNTACEELQRTRWPEMFANGATWPEMRALECEVCRAERDQRDRLVKREDDPRFSMEPFVNAPYIHPHNAPKYEALQTRAVQFARTHNLCINWVVAWDQPLHQDHLALAKDVLDKKRLRWLSYHDQQTEGIMGLFPMIRGMRVRLTSTVNKRLKLFKHRPGIIVGWTLHPDETSVVDDGERRLSQQPRCIYVKFEGVAWRIGDLDPGVYPLFPKTKKWEIGKETKVYAKRTGFELLPDLSGTDHMYQARR